MNRATLVVGLAVLFAVGCNSKPPALEYDQNTLNAADQFRKLAAAYNQAYRAKKRSPTAEELKPYLKQHGDPDALLTSPLDGKPVVIVPGFSPDVTPAEDEQSIVAYEQVGANGKRMTVDIRGTVVFVTDDEFSKIKFVGGHKPR